MISGAKHSQLRQRLLTWSGHVTSWVDEPGLCVLVVRYEDMKAKPIAHQVGRWREGMSEEIAETDRLGGRGE